MMTNRLTADDIGRAAVGIAKSHNLAARIDFCQGSIFVDGDCAMDVNASYRVIREELVRLVAGQRRMFAVKHYGKRIWWLDSGYTVRRMIQIELTESEKEARLDGPSSWARAMRAA